MDRFLDRTDGDGVLGNGRLEWGNDGIMEYWDGSTCIIQIALWLMLSHAVWATVVVKRNQEKMRFPEKSRRNSL